MKDFSRIWWIFGFLVLFSACNKTYLGGLVQVSGPSIGEEKNGLSAKGIPFDWEHMLPAYMYYHPDFDFEVYFPKYMAVFHPGKWRKVKNDEFEIGRAKAIYIDEMRGQRDHYDSTEIYEAMLAVRIGQYDFKEKCFPLENSLLHESSFSTNRAIVNKHIVGLTSPYPNIFNVVFTSVADQDFPVSKIPIEETVAKQVISSRKHKNGYIDRKVHAKVKFRITGARESERYNKYTAQIVELKYQL